MSLLSSSLLGIRLSVMPLGHIYNISSFVNSTKSRLFIVPHWVLNFLWGSIFLRDCFRHQWVLYLLIFHEFHLLFLPLVICCISLFQSYHLVVIALNISCHSYNFFFCPWWYREAILAFSSFFNFLFSFLFEAVFHRYSLIHTDISLLCGYHPCQSFLGF